jgi:hemolysin III
MMDCPKDIYPYRLSDMISGAITHGLGVFLAIAGSIVLITKAYDTKSTIVIISAVIFCASLFLSYLSSTLYHALARTKAKNVFRIFDHCLIFLLIAGTYTPMVLVTIGRTLGWTIFITVWILAIIGIICKSLILGKYPKASAILYLAMGWLLIFFIIPLWHILPLHALMLLFLGGLCYSLGIIFFAHDNIPHFHSIWHLFVLGGGIFHYFLILQYVIVKH